MAEEKVSKWLLYYNNGHAEGVNLLGGQFMHMIEVGVIKIAFCTTENRAFVRGDDGLCKEVKLTQCVF